MPKISFRIDNDLLDRLREEAERLDLPLAVFIRSALEQYFDDEPTDEEILQNLREAMIDVLEGRTYPIREVLNELQDDIVYDEEIHIEEDPQSEMETDAN